MYRIDFLRKDAVLSSSQLKGDKSISCYYAYLITRGLRDSRVQISMYLIMTHGSYGIMPRQTCVTTRLATAKKTSGVLIFKNGNIYNSEP